MKVQVRSLLSGSLFFLAVALVIAGYLQALSVYSPRLLERDRESSVWYLQHVAEEKISESAHLRGIAPTSDRQELLNEAADLLDRVRKLRPDVHYYEYLWAVTRYQAATFDRAESTEPMNREIKRLEAMWEDETEYRNQLANILSYHYVHLDPNPEKATPILEEMIERSPDASEPYDSLIGIKLQEKDRTGAVSLLEEKIERGIDTTGNRETLARLYFENGEWRKSEPLLRGNLAGGAGTSTTWLLYGIVHSILGDQEIASQAYRSFLGGVQSSPPFPAHPSPDRTGYPIEAFPQSPYLILESALTGGPNDRE